MYINKERLCVTVCERVCVSVGTYVCVCPTQMSTGVLLSRNVHIRMCMYRCCPSTDVCYEHMRRRIHVCSMRTYGCVLCIGVPSTDVCYEAHTHTCMAYEEEDTCMQHAYLRMCAMRHTHTHCLEAH